MQAIRSTKRAVASITALVLLNLEFVPPAVAGAGETPLISFAANSTTIVSGQSARLSWATLNAKSCTASGDWKGKQNLTGYYDTGALTASTTYSLTCSNKSYSTTTSVTVTVSGGTSTTVAQPAPTVSLGASPTSLTAGQTTTLTWSSANATGCTASGAWSGVKSVSGSEVSAALNANATFSLTCSGTGGSASQQVAVTVTPGQPSVSLSAMPTAVDLGGTSSLTWKSLNVTSCTASGAWSGAKPTSGSATVGPLQSDSTFTLACTAAGGNAVAMASIAVRAATLSWTQPQSTDGTSLTGLAAFQVNYGSTSQSYTSHVTIGDPTATSYKMALQPGTYYFAIAALDAQGNVRANSNEVSKTVY
jgi:hypothetical protein